ncbi:MAG: hypothetical protein ACFCVG_01405 [Kineosporiaceae bacterium]
MEIVDATAVRGHVPRDSHREGVIEFRRLGEGEAGELGYFTYTLVRFERYYTPRHRHNYDQLRYCLRGEFPYAHRKVIREGWLGYFPEGTFYGPQDVTSTLDASPEVLTVQFGSASMQGFVPGSALHAAREELAVEGRFERGTYIRTRSDGTEERTDGYEAAWSRVTGRPLVYPAARFAEPVLMDPRAFSWFPTDSPGVAERLLGSFGERGVRVSFLRLDDGARALVGRPAAAVCAFVTSGAVALDGRRLPASTALTLQPGERAELVGDGGGEVYLAQLPDLTVPPLQSGAPAGLDAVPEPAATR